MEDGINACGQAGIHKLIRNFFSRETVISRAERPEVQKQSRLTVLFFQRVQQTNIIFCLIRVNAEYPIPRGCCESVAGSDQDNICVQLLLKRTLPVFICVE